MREITVIENTNEIQIKYLDTNHYEVYTSSQKERFMAEVEGYEKYLGLILWDEVNDTTTVE